MRILIVSLFVGLLFTGCNGFIGNKQGEDTTVTTKDKRKAANAEQIKVSGKEKEALVTVSTASGSNMTISGSADVSVNNNNSENTDSYSYADSAIDYTEPKNAALMWLAGLCVITGLVVAIWMGKVVLGLALSIGGACLFGVLFFPWIAGIVLAVIALFGAGWFIYNERYKDGQVTINSDFKTALGIITSAIESVSTSTQSEVKKAIADEAGNLNKSTVKKVISGIKTELNIK